MKLNHLNLTVTDVPKTSEFLQKYFGLRPLAKGNDKMAFLTDDSDQMILSLFHSPEVNYPDTFHIGFIQETPARVDEINLRLREDGYEVDPPSKMHGSWTFYFMCPGGFTIEVLA